MIVTASTAREVGLRSIDYSSLSHRQLPRGSNVPAMVVRDIRPAGTVAPTGRWSGMNASPLGWMMR
jgi:hypothetical protein